MQLLPFVGLHVKKPFFHPDSVSPLRLLQSFGSEKDINTDLLMEGDSRGLQRGFIGNTPGLPPRFPALPSRGISLSDMDNVFYNNQNDNASLSRNHQQHRRAPSCCVVMQDQPCWLEKLPEESEISRNKSYHRRSASDSLTYLENSGSFFMFSNIAEEEESECQSTLTPEKAANQDNEDGDQLTDLLEEIQLLQEQQNLPISAKPQAVKFESNNALGDCNGSASLEGTPGHRVLEPEGVTLQEDDFFGHDGANGDPTSVNFSVNDLDPKKAKRVLGNRQSAQRSRVRKLQYIAELERIVNTLQAEVSSLSLQVLYLKHQRALLNMDNNALKQQVVFFVQEKRSKDSQNEILMRDVRRLQKLTEFQLLHTQKQQQQQPQNHIHRHSSLPPDFVVQMHQYGELNMSTEHAKSGASSLDSLAGLMKEFTGMSLDAGLRRERACRDGDLDGVPAGHATEGNTMKVGEYL